VTWFPVLLQHITLRVLCIQVHVAESMTVSLHSTLLILCHSKQEPRQTICILQHSVPNSLVLPQVGPCQVVLCVSTKFQVSLAFKGECECSLAVSAESIQFLLLGNSVSWKDYGHEGEHKTIHNTHLAFLLVYISTVYV
jgi:hypothetical protein